MRGDVARSQPEPRNHSGGMMLGLSLPAAVEFSFLLGVVTLLSATVYEALTKGDMILHSFGILSPLIGFLSAFVAA